MSYDGYLKFNTKIDSSGFSSGIHKIGSIAKTGLSVIGGFAAGIVGAGSAAAVKIGMSFESQMSKDLIKLSITTRKAANFLNEHVTEV